MNVTFSMAELFGWVFTAASLLGCIYVNKKNIIGMYIWSVVNVCWIVYDLSYEMYAQAFLFAAYTVLSIWGILEWGKETPPCKVKACKCGCHKKGAK